MNKKVMYKTVKNVISFTKLQKCINIIKLNNIFFKF